MTEKEKLIDRVFCSLVEKPQLGESENLVELWHFLGCVMCDGIHSFLSYDHLQKTIDSLSFYGFPELRQQLEDLIKLGAIDTDFAAIRHQNPKPFDQFEQQLEMQTQTIIDRLFPHACRIQMD
jgi:hypothetical protein